MFNQTRNIAIGGLLACLLASFVIYKIIKQTKKAATKLQVGDKAPEFRAKDQDCNVVSLSDLKGKKIVLYFYPKDNTHYCTLEACNLRDYNKELLLKGYEIIGVSSDDAKSHKKFIENHKLPFRLITDCENAIAKQYGTWIPLIRKLGYISRKTFLIDEKGTIELIIDNVKVKEHAAQILNTTSKQKK